MNKEKIPDKSAMFTSIWIYDSHKVRMTIKEYQCFFIGLSIGLFISLLILLIKIKGA